MLLKKWVKLYKLPVIMARARYVSFKSFNVIVLVEKDMRGFHFACGMGHINRSWRISKTPNTTKNVLIIFKLIQQSIMVILSSLVRKNQNLNSRKKKFSLLLRVAFSRQKCLQWYFVAIIVQICREKSFSKFLRAGILC